MRLEREIEIAASPEQVWDKLLDPDCLGEWVTIQEKLEEAPDGDLEPGDRLVQRLKVAGKGFKVSWNVEEVERPTRVVWRGEGPMGSTAHAVYSLRPNGKGTHFTYMNDWGLPGGIAGRAMGAAIKGSAGKEADRSLEKLKKLLEG